MAIKNITPIYPIIYTEGHGYEEVPDNEPLEAVKFNLKNILLTNPGENLSDPEFGVGLRGYLFELETSQNIQGLKQRIINQIQKYANYFSRLNVIVDTSKLYSNTLTVKLEFEFGIKKFSDTLEVTVSI
jgi:hypothetical protein